MKSKEELADVHHDFEGMRASAIEVRPNPPSKLKDTLLNCLDLSTRLRLNKAL